MGIKRELQHRVVDPLQFRFDAFPTLSYQPLPWLNRPKAKRATGTSQRWDFIKPELVHAGVKSAVDIGCNVGFFSFAMAEMGISVIGVDLDDKNLRMAMFARRRLAMANVGFLSMEVSPATASILPLADAALVLSVWHHWVKMFGLAEATRILAAIWDRTSSIMFFETGQQEMPAEFGMPVMNPSPAEWLAEYLGKTCEGASVRNLGEFKAFAPGGSETERTVVRTLFRVCRQ